MMNDVKIIERENTIMQLIFIDYLVCSIFLCRRHGEFIDRVDFCEAFL